MIKDVECKWKPIAIDRKQFDNELIDLIGIEECTDYNFGDFSNKIVDHKRKHAEENVLKLKRKRKHQTNILITPSKQGNTAVNTDITEIEDATCTVGGAWTSFGLSKSLLQGLSVLGFTQPTQIQELTLPAAILGRRDILGAAETGSGKTLAFGLPIINGILNFKSEIEPNFEHDKIKPLYALILTPTRELAIQVTNHLRGVAKFTDINIAVVVGGMAAVKQERLLNRGPEVVVATPGRLWELIQSGNPHLAQINNIKYLAIDETDRMLERGHFEELHNLLELLNEDESKKKKRQNFVFSATLTLVHDVPKYLLHKKKFRDIKMKPEQKLKTIIDVLGISNPKIVDVTQESGTSGSLTECRITCNIDEKDFYVYYFLQKHPGRTLIFCNSIGCVRRLTHILELLNCHCLPLHSAMQQRQRLKNLDRFRDNEFGILIATDVAARGLDIPQVEHVLHYQTPRTSESYVHRSGRTARAFKEGITILLMEPSEFKNYIKLCKTLGKKEDLPIFPVENNFLNAVKQRVNLARELDRMELKVRKTNSEVGWLQKAAEEMDIVVEHLSNQSDDKEIAFNKKTITIKRKQLNSLLARPVFPKGFNGKYPFSSEIPLPFTEGREIHEKAVDVMKKTLEENRKDKRKMIPLFKPNKNKSAEKGGNFKMTKSSLVKQTTIRKGKNSRYFSK